MVTGTIGWTSAGVGPGDALYLSALAFVGDSLYVPPLLPDVPVLRWTRWLGLAAALSAILTVVGLAVGGRLVRFWAQRVRQGAFVLVGTGGPEAALHLAESHAGRRHVIVLDTDDALRALQRTSRRSSTVLVPADPDDAAGVARAAGRAPSAVLFGDEDPMANIVRASAWEGPAERMLRIEIGVVSRDLELLAPDLRTARLVSTNESAARGLVSVLGLTDLAHTRAQPRVRVLMMGLGQRNLALAEALALQCHHPDLARPEVLVLDRDAAGARARLRRERPSLPAACGISIEEMDGMQCCDGATADRLAAIERDGPLTAVVVDVGSETESMSVAMRLAQVQDERQILRAPILVRSRHARAPLPGALRDLTGGVTPFGGTARTPAQAAMDDLAEDMAERLHDLYLDGLPPEDPRVSWRELSSSMRRANLRAALFAVDMLRAGGLVPDGFADPARLRIAPGVASEMDEDRRMAMARAEHDRWCAERLAEGYRRTPPGTRDDARKRHPLLVPWHDLPEGEERKDLSNVDALLATGAERQRLARRLPCWRRRVRIGVIGPMTAEADAVDRLGRAFEATLDESPFGPPGDIALEVVTPAAPGFDRAGARRLMEIWARHARRPAMLLEIRAMTPAGLDAMARPAGEHAAAAGEHAAMVATAGLARSIDARPLDTSDAMLRRDAELFRHTHEAVADRICALADVMAIWTDGGRARASTRSRAHCRANGIPLLDLGESP